MFPTEPTDTQEGTTATQAAGGAQGGEPAGTEHRPVLCVSIHDVAPATWDECERLAEAMREVGELALTWLVVPQYHRAGGEPARMEAGLERAMARGDELALHGFTHLDTAPRGPGLSERFLRGSYSHEGEFAALPADEAARRIQRGRDWFAERGWPLHGFVPPAWLMGQGAWQALRAFDFDYTTTFMRFHLLGAGVGKAGGGGTVLSPSLVYAARNLAGRLASPLLADGLLLALAHRPLIRLSLHPPDVRHPRLLHHAQATVERLLVTHTAMTKAAFARRMLTSTVPSSLPASSAGPSHHSMRDRPGAVPRAC